MWKALCDFCSLGCDLGEPRRLGQKLYKCLGASHWVFERGVYSLWLREWRR